MVGPGPDILCSESKQYYYDFLGGDGQKTIPDHIARHINECQNCQSQLNQLKLALSQTEDTEFQQSQADSAVATMLQLHFAYIGNPVTCETVKPFLPTLLEPTLEVRIPTPITAHLDNCPQCSEDLETIRGLNLNRKQLCRLSQLLADNPTKDEIGCSKTYAAILFVVLMTLRETDAEVLKHLCLCSHCRRALYDYREAVRKDLGNETEQAPFPCEEVSASDIFDYVIPYGFNPANDQYARFRESLCSHVRRCPACLGKMQQLHDTVYAILDRADSEVATVYKIDDSAKGRATGESNDLYSSFPIKVEVLNWKGQAKAKESASTVNFAAALKRKLSSMNLKPLAKVGVAAAAAVLIAAALLLNTPTAKGVTIEQIYKAIDKIRNVYIASFVPEKKEPVQEKWVSRALNVYITKTGEQFVLWDLQNKVKKTKHLGSNSAETIVLSDDIIGETRERMAGSLGLMPFYDISEIPADAEWNHVADAGVEPYTKETKVYDLTWAKYSGSVRFKWRFFVDLKTSLPRRTEFYQKSVADDDYIFMSSKEVEYLSDSKMQGIIKETSF